MSEHDEERGSGGEQHADRRDTVLDAHVLLRQQLQLGNNKQAGQQNLSKEATDWRIARSSDIYEAQHAINDTEAQSWLCCTWHIVTMERTTAMAEVRSTL